MNARAALALLLLPLLAGCVTTGGGSVAGGECKVFEAPKYAVIGKRPYDQDWIDSTIEGGVGGCKWARPAPRPAELDAPRKVKAVVAKPLKKQTPLWLRMLHYSRAAAPAPAPYPEALPAIVVEAPAAAPSAPRSVIDELLNPSDAR